MYSFNNELAKLSLLFLSPSPFSTVHEVGETVSSSSPCHCWFSIGSKKLMDSIISWMEDKGRCCGTQNLSAQFVSVMKPCEVV